MTTAETAGMMDGPAPKHRQLRAILLALAEEELVPHAPVPSERELMQRYGVSRATVREAVGQLVRDGKLYRVRGKGTFVAPPRVESQLHLSSFTEDMRRRGHRPSTVVLRATLDSPPPRVRSALALEEGDAAYRIERVRSADDVPMALELAWYPADPLPGLLGHDLTGSMYRLFAGEYGRPVDSGSQTVWSEVATDANARLLGVAEGSPLLVFRRTSYAGHLPIEYVTSWYRGDRYQVHMSLDRAQADGSGEPPTPGGAS